MFPKFFPRLRFYQKRLPVLAFKPPAVKSVTQSGSGTCRLTVTWSEGADLRNHIKDSPKDRDRSRGRKLHISRVCATFTQVPEQERDSNIHLEDVAESLNFGAEHWAHTPAPPLTINSCAVSGKFYNL